MLFTNSFFFKFQFKLELQWWKPACWIRSDVILYSNYPSDLITSHLWNINMLTGHWGPTKQNLLEQRKLSWSSVRHPCLRKSFRSTGPFAGGHQGSMTCTELTRDPITLQDCSLLLLWQNTLALERWTCMCTNKYTHKDIWRQTFYLAAKSLTFWKVSGQ